MHTHLLYNDIWYSCTPVWNCNGTTNIPWNVIDSRKGTNTFFYYICLSIPRIPMPPTIVTAKDGPTSEMGKYSTPELQAAFNSGREIGRTEGMLYYIKHASGEHAKGG